METRVVDLDLNARDDPGASETQPLRIYVREVSPISFTPGAWLSLSWWSNNLYISDLGVEPRRLSLDVKLFSGSLKYTVMQFLHDPILYYNGIIERNPLTGKYFTTYYQFPCARPRSRVETLEPVQ